MSRIILFNKPYGVLPQFTDKGTEGSPRPTLSQFVDVPGVYPAGRLDMDSEGLMLLTDDGRLQARISDPKYKMAKSYLVQVEGDVADDALVRLRRGVSLKDGLTLPCEAERIADPMLWPRDPPIRVRQSIPDGWIELTIREGRNRQVRRMCEAIDHRVRRLVRTRYGGLTMGRLARGEFRLLSSAEIARLEAMAGMSR